jgi:hypothetical protein
MTRTSKLAGAGQGKVADQRIARQHFAKRSQPPRFGFIGYQHLSRVARISLEAHKRAHSGSDFNRDRLVVLCPLCHRTKVAPYLRGRLVIAPLVQGCFTFTVVGANKWAARV